MPEVTPANSTNEPQPPPGVKVVAITATDVFIPTPDVSWRDLNGEVVVLHLKTGEYHTFNEVGRAMWRHLISKKSIRDIAVEICKEYQAEPTSVEKDVGQLISKLALKGLVIKET